MRIFNIFLCLFLPFLALSQVQWKNINEAEQLAIKSNKKIMVKVYTNWCGWCKEMDRSTFPDENLTKVLNDNYIATIFNAEQPEAVRWNGIENKFIATGNGRGYHELTKKWLGDKMTYPTIVILNEQGQMIQAIPGYRKPLELEQILAYFAINGHHKFPFNEFQQNYQRK
jgi:thioredoxin-related protein